MTKMVKSNRLVSLGLFPPSLVTLPKEGAKRIYLKDYWIFFPILLLLTRCFGWVGMKMNSQLKKKCFVFISIVIFPMCFLERFPFCSPVLSRLCLASLSSGRNQWTSDRIKNLNKRGNSQISLYLFNPEECDYFFLLLRWIGTARSWGL